jgi:hypothetical protein
MDTTKEITWAPHEYIMYAQTKTLFAYWQALIRGRIILAREVITKAYI